MSTGADLQFIEKEPGEWPRMTKREALEEWRSTYLPSVRACYESDGSPNFPARSESWGEFTDWLCKAGQITLKQYKSWAAPPECGK